jgi:hypothetical protein
MCKLNILCSAEDGKCNCHKQKSDLLTSPKPHSNLLCSILSFISSQPEVLKAMTEGKVNPEEIPSVPISPLEIPLTETQDVKEGLSVNLLNDLPSKIFVQKPFSLMIEIVDSKFNRVNFDEPVVFQVALVRKNDQSDFVVLGTCESNGIALFKRLEVLEKTENCLLVVRTPNRPDICYFAADVKIFNKKGKCKVGTS